MESNTNALYLHCDQRRQASEAQAADQQDEAALQALAQKLNRRRPSQLVAQSDAAETDMQQFMDAALADVDGWAP